MARTVDALAHARRRDEFLAATQELIAGKGFAQMSIQDVLDATGTSRGALYHYFGSKQDLLWAVVERMGEALLARLRAAVDGAGPDALDQLRAYFGTLAGGKLQHHGSANNALHMWYSEDNVLVRARLRTHLIDRHAPLLAAIVRRGVDQGAIDTVAPESIGRLLITLIQDLNDELAGLFFAFEAGRAVRTDIDGVILAYTAAIERILGLSEGAITIVGTSELLSWFRGANSTVRGS
ncbi:TetR/AcrR family transcriptional regulator [Mycobacterium syngnathidarum]|uniref:TetR/AcrR family transcriptional regulator n=1 Tax=Mycobacterium syngnathidarum TaxID=1908205 RepID=UPI00095918D0|nr:TetR/AcrR family transcriptional regulator [Mycobacterium syngnathidarum]OLT87755.1 hypothetical protein BKG60_25520 [Mycobacterium syngnathidarum]